MKARTIAYGAYMGLSILFSLSIAALPALFIFFYLFQNLDSIVLGFGWPFPEILDFFQNLFGASFPATLFEHFYFLCLIIPITLTCYCIFLGVLIGMFKLSRKGIPYLENGYYEKETEEWLLYEFYETYYNIIRYFTWFFSIFLESRLRHILFGAKMGAESINGGGLILTPDRTIIGDNCLIGYGAIICAHVYEGDRLYLKPVELGNNVTVGGYAIVFAGSKIGDNVIIGANTVVPKDREIPPNTIWVHGKSIPRKDLPWQVEEEYKALAEETDEIESPERDTDIPSEGEHV
jgi:acetyltransferase-like isoleucine patch superfamily enzyme